MTAATVVFAGGGTGGHLYPALALAERLRERRPELGCLFLHSDRPVDVDVLARAGVPEGDRAASPAAPLGARPRPLLRFVRRWGPAVRHARALLREARAQGAPVAVVATGGFVCAPAAQAARAERLPLFALALDAVPGKASRWVARRAREAWTVYPQPAHPTWTSVGPVLRRAALAPNDPSACRKALALDPDRPTLLVLGGSQGANSLNDFVATELADTAGDLRRALADAGWQILHQTGPRDADRLADLYARVAAPPAHARAYLDPIAHAWGAADLVLTRGGAGAVAEAWANAVPAVVAPYPYHRDQHQAANARPVVDAGGAVLATDRVRPEANRDTLAPALLDLVTHPDRRAAMRSALKGLVRRDGADLLADRLLAALDACP